MEPKDADRLLTRSEVEEFFGISKRFLEITGPRGHGPRFVRIGRLVRYRTSDIRKWIAANTCKRIEDQGGGHAQ